MDLIIISGYSGAGKSIAVHALEDIGYYCIDNLPPALICDFVELCMQNEDYDKIAVVSDTRGGKFFDGIMSSTKKLREMGINFKVLFIEANVDVLINRFKETRRRHPMLEAANNSLEAAVKRELEVLRPLKDSADFLIDTSNIRASQLSSRIKNLFSSDVTNDMNIHCMSFGFKYGPCVEADLIFDVRCLPNPYFVDELKTKTGLDTPVQNYVLSFDEARTLLDKITDLIDFLLPYYKREGKSQLVIAFGCTGGQHRSVTFAQELGKHLLKSSKNVTVSHRDISKRNQ